MKSTSSSNKEYFISFDKELLQHEVIYGFLTTSYWSPGISRETVLSAIANSLTVGAFDNNKNQVGFARLITDHTTFGYLADVFVLESHRGKGLAHDMVRAILELPEVKKFRRLMLATKDAHPIYEKCGFEPITDASFFMQIVRLSR